MTLDIKELRKMEREELLKRLEELRLELIKLKVQAGMGTLKNTANIRNTRKDVARILTVLSEKKREINKENKSNHEE